VIYFYFDLIEVNFEKEREKQFEMQKIADEGLKGMIFFRGSK